MDLNSVKKDHFASVLPQLLCTHLTSSFNIRWVQIWPRTFPLCIGLSLVKVISLTHSIIVILDLSEGWQVTKEWWCWSCISGHFRLQRRLSMNLFLPYYLLNWCQNFSSLAYNFSDQSRDQLQALIETRWYWSPPSQLVWDRDTRLCTIIHVYTSGTSASVIILTHNLLVKNLREAFHKKQAHNA